jgi:small-conductance mechanosensitive channel
MLEGLLRIVDYMASIKPAPLSDPPPPPENQSLTGAEMLALYSELGEDMRALRSTEFAVLTLFYTVASILVAAIFTAVSAESLPLALKIVCTCATCIFLVIFWIHVHIRITHDNRSYAHLLNRRRYLEKTWFWVDMPGRPVNTSTGATGPGYRMTQQMLALSAIFVVGLLVAALVATF